MPFNASILMDTDKEYSINSLQEETMESYLIGLLEFNDDLHTIDTIGQVDYYRALVESINGNEEIALTEAGGTIKDRIIKIIDSIIQFIRNFIRFITGKNVGKKQEEFKQATRNAEQYATTEPENNNDLKIYTFSHYPDLANVDDQKVRSCLNNITAALDSVINGNDIQVSDSMLETAFKAMGKIVSRDTSETDPKKCHACRKDYNGTVKDTASFKEMVMTDLIWTSKIETNFNGFFSYCNTIDFWDINIAKKKLDGLISDLEKSKRNVSRANMIEEKSITTANRLLGYIRTIVNSYTWYINSIVSTDIRNLTYIKKILEPRATVKESAELEMADNAVSMAIYESENSSGSFKDKIVAVINSIIEYIKKFIRILLGKSDEKTNKYYEKTFSGSNPDGPKEYDINEVRKFTIYHYPNINDIDEQKVRSCLNNIISTIDSLANGNKIDVNDTMLETAFKAMGKIVSKDIKQSNELVVHSGRKQYTESVKNAEQFKAMVKANLIYTEAKDIAIGDYFKYCVTAAHYKSSAGVEKIKGIQQDLESCRNKYSKSNITHPELMEQINVLLRYMRTIINSYMWYINTISEADRYHKNYSLNMYQSITGRTVFESAIKESSTIHGEPFDHDTLFDNEDLRDFNRTEWLNLELTTEFYQMRYEHFETMRRMAANEALIRTDSDPNKFNRLITMQEAEMGDLKIKIDKIIQVIKDAINAFFNKIKNTFDVNKKFINANKECIDKNRITLESITSKGDILAGMYRVQQPLHIPDYTEALNADLVDKKTFFKKHILPLLSNTSSRSAKRDLRWDDNMSITDYCKAYFGAAYGQPVTYTGAEIEEHKNNIVTFITSDNASTSEVRKQLSNLERNARKAYNTFTSNNANNKTDANNGENPGTPASTAIQAQHNSFYSVLYDTYFTEVEIDAGAQTEEQRVAVKDKDKASKKPVDCYIDVCRDVLMSRITGIEYVTSELTAIMKAHVKKNGGKINDNDNNTHAATPATDNQ